MKIVWICLIFLLLPMPGASQENESLMARFCIVAENWEKILQEGEIAVYAQKVPISDVLVFRSAAVLDAPVHQVMEVLRRLEIADEWMPDIETKYAVEERSDFEAITFSINKMPWPFAERELLLYNRLFLDRTRKFLVVEVFSVEDEKYPVAQGNVRAHMFCGETMVRPAGVGKTEVELMLFVDPRGFIPAWLVNFFQKRLPYNFMKALEEKASVTHYPLRPAYRPLLVELESILK